MKIIKSLGIEDIKTLSREQKVSINGGVTNQEDCEAHSRPGELVCTWELGACKCRVIIGPC